MGELFQDMIDQENLNQARSNLNNYIKDRNRVVVADVIDEFQLEFIQVNPDLTFEEMRLLKRFADYIKESK